MWAVLLIIITKKSITRLETTVRINTTVSTTDGIFHCQDGNHCHLATPVRMEMSTQMIESSELQLMHQFSHTNMLQHVIAIMMLSRSNHIMIVTLQCSITVLVHEYINDA